jgi:bifunctional DNA-binding transcriptional regulator/antitoxin component of YhaV-PrlF toxin-antitoxin module
MKPDDTTSVIIHVGYQSVGCYNKFMKKIIKRELVHFARNGSVMIPEWLRNELGFKEGTKALASINGKSILLTPLKSNGINKLRGSLKGSGVLKSLMVIRTHERRRK